MSNSNDLTPSYSSLGTGTEANKTLLSAMFAVMPSGQGVEDQEVVLSLYVGALKGYSTELIKNACHAAMRNRMENVSRFRPTPAQMCKWIDEQIHKPMPSSYHIDETRQKYLTPPVNEKLGAEARRAIVDAALSRNGFQRDPSKGGAVAADARDIKEKAAQMKIAAEKALAETDWRAPVQFSDRMKEFLRKQDESRARGINDRMF